MQKKIQKPEEESKAMDPGKPQTKPQEKKKPEIAEVEAHKQDVKTEEAYQYHPGDRPDPFRPFHEEVKAVTAIPECEEAPPGPLTELEISQFTLVAVVAQGQEKVAMVQDKTGKGYLVKTGSFFGKKCGKVVEINPSEGLIVEEPYVDLLGQQRTRRVTLGFKRLQGGGR